MTTDGWRAVQVQIVSTASSWERVYHPAPRTQPTRALAISHGFGEFGHDDFNVAHIDAGKLVWWGWMDEPLTEDLESVAAALGLASVSKP